MGSTANPPCWGAGKPGWLAAQDPKERIRRSRVEAPTLPSRRCPPLGSTFLLLLQRWGKRGGWRRRAVQSLKISRIEASRSGGCWGPHGGHLPRKTLQLCPGPPSPTQCSWPLALCLTLSAHPTRRWHRLLPSRHVGRVLPRSPGGFCA